MQVLFAYYFLYNEIIKRIIIHTITNISIQYEQFKIKIILLIDVLNGLTVLGLPDDKFIRT